MSDQNQNLEKKQNEKNNYTKSIAFTLILVLVLVVTVIGVTYAIFTFSKAGTVTNKITTGTVSCSITESEPINITGAQPISDATGKTLAANSIVGYTTGYYDATVACTCSGTCSGNYELYLKPNAANTLDSQYVKTYLTDGNATEVQLNPVTTFNNLTAATADATAKRIYYKTFTSSFSEKYRLRVWLSDQYTVTGTANTFKAIMSAKVSG